ncbi:hypothetical protein WICMUC_004519 [Wickerhamomyces mucosus]|uniref:Activator of Hsp90 ATPase AHSA1-like N-terminal domain-containing protein n=1 Tax=Wickerhamomyces mucosus TaxID=1378264 RepID=A0A9P8PIQ1_9ASCO|nr:hypothetical protein WICMUC_004519 [Wickerhamomyces mucosus]
MVVNNPNNWHWTSLNALPWSKEYFNSNVIGLKAETESQRVEINSIPSIEGDVEVSQRKGKVISLFDIKVVLNWEGVSNGEDVKGTITIPEIAYDTEEDEYQFEISIFNENNSNGKIKEIIRSKLVPQLRKVLGKFGKDLLETNAIEIQLPADQVQSTFTKANQVTNTSIKSETKSTTSKSKTNETVTKSSSSSSSSSNAPKYNTSTLHFEPIFNTTAEQLFITFLDKNRIGAWTRSQPDFQGESLIEGSSFNLFGGNISGKILELIPNEKIRQSWRLNSWKKDHYAELEINIYQGDSETKLNVLFKGIPIGEEEIVQSNFEDYYVRSIKITFGFGAVL